MSDPRVLVIDDDEDIRGLVRALLERSGATVRDAPNGQEGLREVHTWRPDLVILDVSMPELDGWNVPERIRDMSDVPVMMPTAAGDEPGCGGDQLKLYIGYLRRKLEPEEPDNVPIETVRGFGYRYKAPA